MRPSAGVRVPPNVRTRRAGGRPAVDEVREVDVSDAPLEEQREHPASDPGRAAVEPVEEHEPGVLVDSRDEVVFVDEGGVVGRGIW